MLSEEHRHIEMENSQYQNRSYPVYQNLVLTKPSDIDKCISKRRPRYLRRWPYLTEVLKGKMTDHAIKEVIINIQ